MGFLGRASLPLLEGRTPYDWASRRAVLELEMSTEEYARRLAVVRTSMEEGGLGALVLVSTGVETSNIQYISGFSSLQGTSIALVHPTYEPVLITCAFAHFEPMHSNIQTACWETFLGTRNEADLLSVAVAVLSDWGVAKHDIGLVGLDRCGYRFVSDLKEALSSFTTRAADAILSRQRMRKSEEELQVIRLAALKTSDAMRAALDAVVAGATEADIAAVAHAASMRAGAQKMIFGSFVAAGARGSLKNVAPRLDKRVAPGELVIVDLGFKFQGYHTDLCRNTVVGEPPAPVRRLLEVCLEIGGEAIDYIRPGVTTHDVIERMAQVSRRHGLEDQNWSFCHGGGLEIEEEPIFLGAPPRVLEPGMCFFLEPILVDTELGCACIEDMVVVTDRGCEVLTNVPRKTW